MDFRMQNTFHNTNETFINHFRKKYRCFIYIRILYPNENIYLFFYFIILNCVQYFGQKTENNK